MTDGEGAKNVSSKGLQQGGVEINRPDSGLDETLLVYQVWVRTGRRGWQAIFVEYDYDSSCGDCIVPSLSDVYSSYDDISLSKDGLLSCPAATASELFQEKCDLAYLPVPIQDEYATDSDMHGYRSVNPTQRKRHPAEVPPTRGYKSAIPRLTAIYCHRPVKQSHSRGAVKYNAPETKLLSLIIGNVVSSQARTILPPQGRQQTFKEYIDRRRERKEYVSSKGLQQGSVEINRPDSGLDETLLVYQVYVCTGRRVGIRDSRTSQTIDTHSTLGK